MHRWSMFHFKSEVGELQFLEGMNTNRICRAVIDLLYRGDFSAIAREPRVDPLKSGWCPAQNLLCSSCDFGFCYASTLWVGDSKETGDSKESLLFPHCGSLRSFRSWQLRSQLLGLPSRSSAGHAWTSYRVTTQAGYRLAPRKHHAGTWQIQLFH